VYECRLEKRYVVIVFENGLLCRNFLYSLGNIGKCYPGLGTSTKVFLCKLLDLPTLVHCVLYIRKKFIFVLTICGESYRFMDWNDVEVYNELLAVCECLDVERNLFSLTFCR
jgi:hypothetical protein